MTKIICHEIPEFDDENVNKLLNSGEEYKIIEGLISTAFYSGNYELSMKLAFEYVESRNVNVKGCAIECFGHIARIHGRLDLLGLLTECLKPNNNWKVLKHRLLKEGSQLVTNFNQLKMEAAEDKFLESKSKYWLMITF